MDAIYLLIPIALILVIIAVTVFFWAVKSDQFEDMEGPAYSILFDDDKPPSKQNNAAEKTESELPSSSDNTSRKR